MNTLDPNIYIHLQLTDKEFAQLSSFIYKESGIKLPPIKKIMLQSRLHKRLKELQIPSFKEYCDYVFSPEGMDSELVHMLDVVSTNKTDFFREPAHFDFITNYVLPQHTDENQGSIFNAWSAGCSSGEEPYTLAIVLSEYMEKDPRFNYAITATDLSTKILNCATNAVYSEDKVAAIPLNLKQKYLLRSKDRAQKTVKIAPEIRNKVSFSRLNFMDSTYRLNNMFNLIMCRNVLIYFDRETQEKVINKLCTKLLPGGYLMLGHSESILNMKFPLKQVKPTIYQRI